MRASDADEYVYVVRNIVINEAVVHTREGSSQKSWDGQKSLKNVFYQEAASKLQRSHTSTHSMVTLKSIRRVSVCEANNTIVAWEKIVGTVRITTLYIYHRSCHQYIVCYSELLTEFELRLVGLPGVKYLSFSLTLGDLDLTIAALYMRVLLWIAAHTHRSSCQHINNLALHHHAMQIDLELLE